MNSFYITLPSNSSSKIYPNNKQSNFRTQLANEVQLSTPYEVALAEINYSPNISTDLGKIEVNSFYTGVFENFRGTISSNVKIFHKISVDELCTLLNSTLEKAILYDYYSTLYSVLFRLSNEIINRNNFTNQLKFKKDNFYIELFKTSEKSSNFVFIDNENSVFKNDFLKLLPDLKFNKKLKRWEFSFDDVKKLKSKFKCRIFILRYAFSSFINNQAEFNQFIALDHSDELEQIRFRDEFDFLKEFGISDKNISNNFPYLDISEEKSVATNTLDIPKFSLVTYIDNRKSAIKVSYKKDIKLMISMSDRLSWLFNEVKMSYLIQDHVYVIDTFIHPLSYAVIYTDIIQDQYFGDVVSNILKIIPLKTESDTEVVSFFDNLHYIPLNKTKFTSINIEIRDLFGELIKFEDRFTFVIIKLHFRKLRNE